MSDHKDMRLDRRLTQRRGWITPKDLQKELDALVDLTDKAELIDLPGNPAPEADAAPSDAAIQ